MATGPGIYARDIDIGKPKVADLRELLIALEAIAGDNSPNIVDRVEEN